MSTNNANLLSQSPEKLAQMMFDQKVETGFIINTENGLRGSNVLFQDLAKEISQMKDFSKHEAIFIKYDVETSCFYMVFVHSTKRGQAQGGTRLKYKGYETLKGSIADGMRLSKGMTDKNSISEIWWGGGKAIICPINENENRKLKDQKKDENGKDQVTPNGQKDYTDEATALRKTVFTNYGKFVASLGGVYIAAEDMYTDNRDMKTILSVCRFVTCLPTDVGGSGNPSEWTAKGVCNAMLAAMKVYEKKDNLEGKTINVQGIGNVGGYLVEQVLLNGASTVNFFDIDEELLNRSIEQYKKSYPTREINIVSEDEINTRACDIFAPCAIGGILDKTSISKLKCKYVIGAANNQLYDFYEDYKLLAERSITYLPDFYINRLGIINCANEQYGYLESDRKRDVEKIYDDPINGTIHLLKESIRQNKPPQEVALEMAERLGQETHPYWKNRGADIIKELTKSGSKLWSA